uniref:HMG-Y-related protein A n=1 Tax=Solanum chacoense TaxID=4108 RepID=A0A0V0HI12_SOLCH
MATEFVNKIHPEYPQMIYEALDALQQKEGSNKSSISKYIESKYGNMNDAHSKLLTYHLDRMKQTGELIFLKNNYIKPGPDAPPKRGRGRPPKPKTTLPQGTEIAAPKPRGRPKKRPQCTTYFQETKTNKCP